MAELCTSVWAALVAIGTLIGAAVINGKHRKNDHWSGSGSRMLLVGIPMAIGALGFTSAGIAAGSVAAKMMSAAAIANGGGVAAGSSVAMLQSIGAAGCSLGTKIGLGTLGSAAGATLLKRNTPK